jgi:hypothetical protein
LKVGQVRVLEPNLVSQQQADQQQQQLLMQQQAAASSTHRIIVRSTATWLASLDLIQFVH